MESPPVAEYRGIEMKFDESKDYIKNQRKHALRLKQKFERNYVDEDDFSDLNPKRRDSAYGRRQADFDECNFITKRSRSVRELLDVLE